MWGNNKHCETTHNNYSKLSLPRMCFKLKNEKIIQISGGYEHNIALGSNNSIFTWGNNEYGQCANSKLEETNIKRIKIQNEEIIQIGAGNEHSLILTKNGEIYSCGNKYSGVLGYKIEEGIKKTKDFNSKKDNAEWKLRKLESIKNIIRICCGPIHNLALDNEGKVYSWGSAEGGQLGLNDEYIVNSIIKKEK
jgi:regulator of chromosome condensation